MSDGVRFVIMVFFIKVYTSSLFWSAWPRSLVRFLWA